MTITRRTLTGGVAAAAALGTVPLATVPATAQTTAAPSGAPIRIGMGMAQTGGLAAGGRMSLVAMELWRQDVNARGGLLGRPVEFVIYDDQSNPATVPSLYNKLLDIDHVDLVVSGYGTAQIAAAMPTMIQRGKVFMGLFALGIADRYNYGRFFQMQPNGANARRDFSRGFFEVAMTMNPRPTTIAMTGADAEFSQLALDGARENARAHDLRVVYDQTYPPNAIDFATIIRGIRARRPDLVFFGSYPTDSAGLIRAVSEVGLTARMVGGGMIGPQYASVKTQLGPLLNGLVCYDIYVPEPTMRFPGIEQFLTRYQAIAARESVDELGYYLPPYAYAELQVLEAGVRATNSLDDAAIATWIHANRTPTVVGDLAFGPAGEWADERILMVQYRGIVGNGIDQFKQAGRAVILHPFNLKSGELQTPFTPTRG